MPHPTLASQAAPSENDVYHVYSLCYARLPTRTAHENFAIRDMHDGPMAMDFNLWILRNARRTVLVDTGFSPRAAEARQRPLDFDPVAALVELGVDPDAIEDIILTHLHYDHAGNIDRFGKARFHVQDAEVTLATGRCMCDWAIRRAFDVEDIVTLVRHAYADRVCFHDGDATPLPGISLHALPGHSAGMQAVRVITPRGPIVLASDASHYYANIARRSPFAFTLNVPETLRSYDQLLALAGSIERVIPGHDPKVRAFYPSHAICGFEVVSLHEEPHPHPLSTLVQP